MSAQYFVQLLAVLTRSSMFFRLNALDYRELKEKLQAPVRNARNILIRQTLSEQFLQAFAEQLAQNPVFHPPEEMVIYSHVDIKVLIKV